MRTIATAAVVLGGLALFARQADACTAYTAVDKARASRYSDSYAAAKTVASEVLDQEGFVNKDKWKSGGSPIEAATGSMLIDWFGNDGDDVQTSDRGERQCGVITVKAARSFLTRGSNYHNEATTVRAHMLLHANEYRTAAPSPAPAPAPAPVVTAPPEPAPAPAPAPAPVASGPAPAPAPTPTSGPSFSWPSFGFPPFGSKPATPAPAPVATPAPVAAPAPTPVSIPEPALPLEHFAG